MSLPTVRLRFAPSPTGYLHVGGARTALFNYLFARRNGGVFILRIEDTDLERSSDDMVGGILDGLKWLGLEWDEGPEVGGPHAPYFQSGRLDRYRAMGEKLVVDGVAYYCYCTPGRQAAQAGAARGSDEVVKAGDGDDAVKTPEYQTRCACATFSAEQIAAREARHEPRAIRFRVPEGRTEFNDLVHGKVSFDNSVIEDFVVLRSDGQPTYHLSVVCDDIDMEVTHVVRGDDHVSNTPKQVMLYRAFGEKLPAFAHVPLILGPDKRRLSKRHGATSVTEYKRQGYLAEAMVNFLALLGWSPGNDNEVFTKEELIAAFSLEAISSSNAVFNPEKLDWFNSQHIIRMPIEDLASRVQPLLQQAGVWRESYLSDERDWYFKVLDLLRARARKLEDFPRHGHPFFSDTVSYNPVAVEKHLSNAALAGPLRALKHAFEHMDGFDAVEIERVLRQTAAEQQQKAAALIHAARVAVTGEAVSAGIFEVLALLGRSRTVERLTHAVSMLESR